jgi:hypothetical protein
MNHAMKIALSAWLFPLAVYAGDFSNPIPYGSSGFGSSTSASTAYAPVPLATAESLRIARMNVGTPNSVINAYTVRNDQCINCITVGDNASDVNIDATQEAAGACVNVSNNILNNNEADAAQTCTEALQ